MSSMPLTIQQTKQKQKIVIEMNADKFEKLAATFGFFNPEFVKSLDRAEKDYKTGRTKKIKSLKELRS